MAVDVCNEIPSLVVSPRLSFSNDLNQNDIFPLRSDSFLLLPTSTDFNFCIVAQQISSADELFSNGKILPTQIKKTQEHPNSKPIPNNSNEDAATKKRLKDLLFDTNEEDQEEEEKPLSKSFWKFTRSTSLNFDSGKGKSLLRTFQKLSRSHSTGSAPVSKQLMPPKFLEKQHSQKQQQQQQQQQTMFTRSNSSSATPSNTYYYAYNNLPSRRPPLKKNCSRGYGSGVRISPVLNIPPAYGSISFFGFGSLFCNGKDKKKKK